MAERDQDREQPDNQVDEGTRNSNIREETNLRESLGDLGIGNETEKITPQNDLFRDEKQKSE